MDLLSDLNPQQRQAVTAGAGPILVLAGPGSGKTRVLTRRIAYLIGAAGIRPSNILAVTFTNRAAREMENRVNELLGGATRGITLGTFHSICARILRREAESLPFGSNFVIFDEDDQLHLVKQALQDLNLDEKRYRAPAMLHAISTGKNELVLPETYPVNNYQGEIVRRVYKRYQELLLKNNALDFDDLLLWSAILLERNTGVSEKYSRRFEHILVDEFQDTNLAQYTLIKRLASFHNNIFVVGDTDQAIYRWRGADYRNVLQFEVDYPDSQVILLEQNYRSTQAILDVAMAVINRNPYRKEKALFTDRGEGIRAVLYEAEDDRVEAAFIVDLMKTLSARMRAQPGDFAIMYRTNAQSRMIEEALLNAGVRYKLVGAQRFYGRREVKDIIAYMRLVHNPDDELSFGRVVNTPTRGIGDKTVLNLQALTRQDGKTLGRLVLELVRQPGSKLNETFSGRAAAALSGFGKLLAGWIGLKTDCSPLMLMDRILEDIDYHSYIDDGSDEGHDRWENVMELRRLASEFSEPGLEAFLERVALVSDQDTLENGGNVPTLLTLHAAKGLEFPIVVIVGLSDGTLPHSRSFDDPEAMMEERRLLYVGITRAKDRLFLVYPQNRTAYGYPTPAEPSRFLADIPFAMLEELQSTRKESRSKPTITYSGSRWTPPSRDITTPQQDAQPRFRPGMRVEHPSWGEGMVLKSEMQSGNEIVDVFFAGIGLKHLDAAIGGLQPKS